MNILYTRAAGGSVQARPHPATPSRSSPVQPGRLRSTKWRDRSASCFAQAINFPDAEAETGPATVCEARCPNSSGGSATLLHRKSQHAGVARRGRLGAKAGADHNQPAPTKSLNPPLCSPAAPARMATLFSSRGFGTDQAPGFRREVHAAHSGHRGFRPSGQGAHAGRAEPAVDTVLVSRNGINPARHLGSLGKARTLDRPLGAAGSQLSDRSSSDLPRLPSRTRYPSCSRCMTLPNGLPSERQPAAVLIIIKERKN